MAAEFTDAQKADIRRYCGYPAYGDGAVVFPQPWIMRQYLALEYRIAHLMPAEADVVVNTYLANLATLEAAIPSAGGNLDTDQAAVWKRNPNEVRDRERLFDSWRRRLCGFLGVPAGPDLGNSGSIALVV